jgi:hypothetical protein
MLRDVITKKNLQDHAVQQPVRPQIDFWKTVSRKAKEMELAQNYIQWWEFVVLNLQVLLSET